MSQASKSDHVPSADELTAELGRIKKRKRVFYLIRSTLSVLIVAAAIAVLVSMLWLPVLKTFGHSMTPTLEDGDLVLSVKTPHLEQGDLAAFYSNNKILIKRVIAGPGDWVVIDKDGAVFINGEKLDEPYVSEAAYGNANIEFPYQVPDSSWFVMGDHRATSIDSRNTAVGPVYEEQIVGKIIFRLWPMGKVN